MNQKKYIFLILLLISFGLEVRSQNKGYVIPNTVFYLDASSAPYNQVVGGDTLYLQSGNRDYLQFKNFQGKPGSPIVIINQGGDVIIDTNNYYGISVQNCRYIKLTGTGMTGMQYGFKIKRVANGAGLSLGYLSSDYEIDHVSIENTLLGGLYAKTDPDCSIPSTREKFTQYNTIIHDNYIASTGDEGMYIGSTKFSGQTVNCNGRDTLLFPSLLDGVQVYNNIVKYSGWDGIQVSSASKNCQIYNNTVLFDSQDGFDSQMSGIIIGGGTKCDCFNNYIADGKGVGIECHGLGGSRIFNNIIVNPGLTYFPGDFTKPKHGIFVSDNSVQKDSTFYIFNNTIINPKDDGIRFSSVLSKGNLISSNVIINPGAYDYYQNGNTSFKGIDSYVMIQQTGTDVTLKNNFFDRTGTTAKFFSQTMHAANDFVPVAGSVLIDAADTNPKVSTTFDYANNPRPFGIRSDIGAFEYIVCTNPISGGAIASPQSICSGTIPAAFTSTSLPLGFSGKLEYKWQFSTTSANGTFTDIANSNLPTYASRALTTTTWFRRLSRVTCMSDWTGAAISNVFSVTVNPLPAANTSANRAICLNSGAQLGALTVPGSTYSWSSSPVGFSSTVATPTVNPLVNTTYTLTETVSATGCSNRHSVILTVNPLPLASAGSNRTICQNSTTQIGATAVTGNTYSWSSSPAGFSSTIANPTVTPLVTTTYLLVETISATGCTNTHSVTVTVNPLPAALAGANRTICQNSGTQIGAAPVTGNSYNWTSSPAGFTSTSANPTVTPSATTTYTVIETILATGCTNTHSVIVTVNPLPAAIAGADRAICLNSNTQIGSIAVNGNTYSWTSSPAGFTSTSANPTVTPLVNTIYTLVETVSTTGCISTHSVKVNVNLFQLPTITGSASACEGTTDIKYSTEASMTNYSWTVSPGGSITSGTGSNTITVTWNTSGLQSVSANYSNPTGCATAAPTVKNVVVNPLPLPTITGSSSLCASSAGVQYTTEPSMTGYSWKVSADGIITAGSGTNTATVTWNSSGTKTISVNYINANGCTLNAPIDRSITILPLPGLPGSITGNTTICGSAAGETYSIAPIANATSYVWILPSGATFVSGASSSSVKVNFDSGFTSGTISVYGTNSCGKSNSANLVISVAPQPAAAGFISGPAAACQGSTGLIYLVQPILNATGYSWNLPAGVTIVSGANTNRIVVDLAKNASTGPITVYGIDKCLNGIVSPTFSLTVNPIPSAPVITTAGFALTSSAPLGNQWYYSATKTSIASEISGATSPTFSPIQDGYYWSIVTLNGCVSIGSNQVFRLKAGEANRYNVYPVPNQGQFTVAITTSDQEIFTIQVLDQLGNTVYELPNQSVNGEFLKTVNLNNPASGVYFVILRSNTGDEVFRKISIFK